MQNRPLPEDPMVRNLIKIARNSQVSRRTFLAGTGGGAVALGLAACAPDAAEITAAEDISATDKTLNWSNWTLYLDQDDNANYPTLMRFEKETGIKVQYREDYDDNNTYYAKFRDQLSLGQDIGADIVVPTEWMAARWGQLNYVQELNAANIPNKTNVIDSLANPDWDPGRAKSLPWQGGFAGIAYNVDEVGEIRTVEDLWRPELKGRVVVLSEMRDTVGLLMMANGVDISSDWGADQFDAALDVLREQVASGQIRNVRGNSYKEDLVNGDALAAIGWSGDITQINFENGYDDGEKWKFVFPESGATLWNDTMIIPIGSPRKTNAEILMNYYYQPEVAAEVAAYVNYVTPVKGAYEAAIEIDPELAENKLIFPDEATLAQSQAFRTLKSDEENEFQAAFQAIALDA
jgi:spermidine/putrescine transport system substrate-binding protein